MAYRETMENNGMEAGRAKNQIPYCTVVLVALNVILFLIGLILPKAGEWMESEGCFSVVYLLYEHSGFYRLITAAFLHADVEHLLNNMLLLYCCGDVVERCLGKVRFLILYFGSAIFGNLLSAAYELSTGSFYEIDRSQRSGFRADGCVAFSGNCQKRSGCGNFSEKSGIRRCPVSVCRVWQCVCEQCGACRRTVERFSSWIFIKHYTAGI